MNEVNAAYHYNLLSQKRPVSRFVQNLLAINFIVQNDPELHTEIFPTPIQIYERYFS